MKALAFLALLGAAYWLLPLLISHGRHCPACGGTGRRELGDGRFRWCRHYSGKGKIIRRDPPA